MTTNAHTGHATTARPTPQPTSNAAPGFDVGGRATHRNHGDHIEAEQATAAVEHPHADHHTAYVGPEARRAAERVGHHATHAAEHTGNDGGHAGHAADAVQVGHGAGPGGLLITQDGYTLDLETTIAEPGGIDFRFRILGPDGAAVTEFDPIHDRELHLIVARRELTGFWHVHPRREADGTWAIPLELPEAGAYRVFTDIAPRALGRTITLGADLAIAGHYAPQPVPAVGRTAEVDGYELTVDGELRTDGDLLTLTVRKDGASVTDLQPYLAAFGHLVILRAGDLAYVHVHPNGEPGDGITPAGPGISFHTTVPGPGTYRLFLDFRHNDAVRTAAFTLTAPQSAERTQHR
ncbi:hypothetical protein [Nocardia mangyaensis]|uniref:hypothetical protein n=1 Tax=Nocardia mangyaensis TaxID=2213200 RepID=UPI0026769CAB|nr:hypothetical protein [Nocardia mangyaensis]MDO3648543.1 hypothetical protein [Nocardia mangyaensis]